MNHKFVSDVVNPANCKECKRDVVSHSEYAKCEVCGKFPCSVDTYKQYDSLMCAGCIASENEAEIESAERKKQDYIKSVEEKRYESQAAQIDKIAKDNKISPLVDLPQTGDEFFNAETIDILSLEKRVMADDSIPADKKYMFMANELQQRYRHMEKTVLEGIKVITECRSRAAANQRGLNLLASKLRSEERTKLKITDINYKVVEPPKKVNTRTTAKDKVIEGMAKIFFAPKDNKGNIIWNELTDEQRQECINQARKQFSGTYGSIAAASKIIDTGADVGPNDNEDK
jgi:hypothetical protein